MKKFIFLIFIVACTNDVESQNEITTTTSSTSTTVSVTSTTLPEILSEKLYASDLTIGDCFDYLDGEGYYFLADYYVTRVPCDTLHSYEIISIINYRF